jgi:hypothetical protein
MHGRWELQIFSLREQTSCRNHSKWEDYFKMALEEYGELDLNVLDRVNSQIICDLYKMSYLLVT